MVAEAEENNSDDSRWHRWQTCSLCEQAYHGVVSCALGWACWKTYVGRPEGDRDRTDAMSELGNGLHAGEHYEDALSVMEASLSTLRRFGAAEQNILVDQGNLANTYSMLGRLEEANRMLRDVCSGRSKLHGEESYETLMAASNYASSLVDLRHFGEAKSLLRKTMPTARRILGESHRTTLKMRWFHAEALYKDASARLDDLREAVTTLEDVERIARRTFGGTHPFAVRIEGSLRAARETLRLISKKN